MKMSGKEFLEEALQFTIQKICKFSLHIEASYLYLGNQFLLTFILFNRWNQQDCQIAQQRIRWRTA